MPNGYSVQFSNEPFRQAYLESEEPVAIICARLGWKPDVSRLERVLGLKPDKDMDGPRTHVTEGMAVKLCDAFLLDPWEVGL